MSVSGCCSWVLHGRLCIETTSIWWNRPGEHFVALSVVPVQLRELTFNGTQGGQGLHPANSGRCTDASFKDHDAKHRRRIIKNFGETAASFLISRLVIRELYAPATLAQCMKPRYPLARGLARPRSRCERCGTEENLLLLTGIELCPSGP
jgi:hypothetical protein